MHSQLSACFATLDAALEDLRVAVASVPEPLRGQRAAADRWSVNEVLEHVSLVEQLFVKPLGEKIATARGSLGREVDKPASLDAGLRAFLTNRDNKRTAPETVQPTGTVDATTALGMLASVHARLLKVVSDVDGLALSTVTYDHRFFGTLNVYQWIELLAGHETRHAAQIREIAGQLTQA
ncbi:MAG TPA: DinB family protein [Vicinamibacterales bacterium]|jgi:hypothetical protein|nr:DinB family protein [Vicinamibacterales bacterium]